MMNVYDFDGTIYNGDSSLDFYFFSLINNPLIIRFAIKQFYGVILFCFKMISITGLKEYFFSFLSGIDTLEMVEKFWSKNYNKIQNWYLLQQKEDDIIISASPEFLIKPICVKLGISHIIASRVNPNNGSFIGANCKGKEKLNRLTKEYHLKHINCFYSDSLSDEPLANISDEAFLIEKGSIKKWKL